VGQSDGGGGDHRVRVRLPMRRRDDETRETRETIIRRRRALQTNEPTDEPTNKRRVAGAFSEIMFHRRHLVTLS